MVGKRIIKSKLFISILILVILALGFTYWANYKITSTAKPFVFNNVKDVPEVKVGLLLGASKLTANGYENYYSAHLIRSSVQKKFLVRQKSH